MIPIKLLSLSTLMLLTACAVSSNGKAGAHDIKAQASKKPHLSENPYTKPHPVTDRMKDGTHWRISQIGNDVLERGNHGLFIKPNDHNSTVGRVVIFDGCSDLQGDILRPSNITRNRASVESWRKAHEGGGNFHIYQNSVYKSRDCKTHASTKTKEAYEQLLKGPIRMQLDKAEIEIQYKEPPYSMGPNLPGPTLSGPVIRLEPVIPKDISDVEGVTLSPSAGGSSWIKLKDGDLRGFDGCHLIGAYYYPTETGIHTVPAGIEASYDTCGTEIGFKTNAFEVIGNSPDYVGKKNRKATFRNKYGTASFSTEHNDDAIETYFPVGSHWRLSEFNGQPVHSDGDHGIRIDNDNRAVFHNGCFGQQTSLWMGGNYVAFTPNGVAADGMNHMRGHQGNCSINISDEILNTLGNYQSLLSKAWTVKPISQSLSLNFLDEDGKHHQAILTPDKNELLSSLIGKKLTLTSASALGNRLGQLKRPATLSINADRIGGWDGCNHTGGSYKFVNNRIVLTGGMTTAMGCARNAEGVPEAFNRLYDSKATLTFKGNYLYAKDGKKYSIFKISDQTNEDKK